MRAIKKATVLVVFFFSTLFSEGIFAQNYTPSPENIEARAWFQEARFGLFVHWGVYSILGDGEWVMNNQNIAIDEYEKLPTFFNPIDFDPVAWVSIVKEAGMKYITITSRHHDGFSMFDSKATDYDIVDATPYGKDVLKLLAEECRKQGIKLFFYYSLLDWNRDDYFPRGRTGTKIPGRGTGTWKNYIDFMKTQLTELLTNYGEIGGIWFDGHWDQKEWDGEKFGKLKVDWHYNEIYSLIHRLQPQALIGNNHHIGVIDGEDFQMFEKDLPGKNTTGWGTASDQIGSVPLEVCETINGSWGFNLQDRKHKSDKELIHYLIKAAGFGSNMLLNVGPMPNGEIQPKHQASLKAIGKWLRSNAKTIYGTQRGPIAPTDDFVSTQKGKIVYLHLLNPDLNIIHTDQIHLKIKHIRVLKTQKLIPFRNDKFGLVLDVSLLSKDPIDTVIQIELR
ncbi:MAG: alpha-L-fucosidase [Flavobacteriaceae bacterium]|jgi:alpha-L-fucosidase|tara:strand:- start:3361 stop:4707 length:1347 start_codon:yes stop_codon:yes gene_type:complete